MKNNRKYLFALICVSVLIITIGAITIASSGFASAKYKTQQVVNQVPITITVSADLADTLEVREHAAIRQESGEYVLDSGRVTSSNSYILMPGVDIPKDPFVRVNGKTAIPAYLYIEVVDSTGLDNAAFLYTVSSQWTALKDGSNNDVIGKNRGKVYVYQNGIAITSADTTEGVLEAPILNDNKVTVNPGFDVSSLLTNARLSFYAYMAQAVDGKTAYQIFASQLAS